MSLINKIPQKPTKAILSQDELEFLLKLVANSKFEGKDVQLVYSTAVKLQQIITG